MQASRKPPFLYEGARTAAISFPLGGIGTGSLGLSGAGRLIDWEIFNRPAKGSLNALSHFAVRAEADGRTLDARILNGPFRGNAMGDGDGAAYRSFGFGARRGSLVGMPHFKNNSFDGRFPVAELEFTDPAFPGTVGLTAFNPFIPTNERDSSLPAAMFEVSFHNPLEMPVTYTLAAVLGHEMPGQPMAHARTGAGWNGIFIHDGAVAADAPERAELLVATDAAETSRQTYLFRGIWYDALEVYWKDFGRPGPLRDRVYKHRDDRPGMIRDHDCSVQAAHLTVAPGATGTIRMLIGWYVPNFQKYWISPIWHFSDSSLASGEWQNWYGTEWPGVTAVADEIFARWAELRRDTLAFRGALYGSSLPWAFREAAGANLSTLKSNTVLRLTDGTLYGWEGCHPTAGSCEGSCTHVWNYQQAVASLFPKLSRSMREADYAHNLDATGAMSFRLGLPLGNHLKTEHPCADGQFGGIMLVYREWKISGDDDWLKTLWPGVKLSLEFAWSPDNAYRWDTERSGVLQGRQHHTLDMELFGPNAWLTGYYLGALAAAAEMAEALGETEPAAEYRAIAARGRAYVDAHLFNGSYFFHQVDLGDKRVLAPFRKADRSRRQLGATTEMQYWSEEHGELKYQLGEACFIDQLASQWHATLYGLPDIFAPEKRLAALAAMRTHNFKPQLSAVANSGRVFGYDDEAGTIVAAWPAGRRQPAVSIPYAQETLHGMEYALGGTLLQHGMIADAVETVAAVRDRYDGALRNPWNEMECGSNYARSLSSWGLIPLSAGQSVDGRTRHLGFDPIVGRNGRFRGIWSSAAAWGRVMLVSGHLLVRVEYGTLELDSLGLPMTLPMTETTMPQLRRNGAPVATQRHGDHLRFARQSLQRGDLLVVSGAGIGLRPPAPNPFTATE